MEISQGTLYCMAESELLYQILEEGNMPISYAILIAENQHKWYSPSLQIKATEWLNKSLPQPEETPDVFTDMGLDNIEIPF